MGLVLLDSGASYPPVPTRGRVLDAQLTFQGLTVQTAQFGTLPLFDPVIGWFSGPTRWADIDAVLAAHTAAGDQCVQVAVSGQYAESGQAYENIPGVNYYNDLAGLNTLLDYLITRNWIIDLRCGYDGQGMDPTGLTWGWQFGMDNYARLAASLGNRINYCRVNPCYDGWCPNWSADQARQFAAMVRQATPDVALVGEFAIGYSHMGGGATDYAPGGCFYEWDGFEGEYEANPGTGLVHDDNVWQIVARLARPYVRPPDQPSGDDPDPPFYLSGTNSRGLPYHYRMLEWGIYYTVRWQLSDAAVADSNNRGYLKALAPGTSCG